MSSAVLGDDLLGVVKKGVQGAKSKLYLTTQHLIYDNLKKLNAVIPSGQKLTNLSKTIINKYGYFIKPESGVLKSKIDQIVTHGDYDGILTEELVDEIMKGNGFLTLNGKYASNNGFDGIYIKGSIDNPSEIVIVECKQFNYSKDPSGVLG